MADQAGAPDSAAIPDAPESEAPETPTQEPAETAAPETAPETADRYAGIEDLDADEILRRHPKLQGKVGIAAQKQAQAEARKLAEQLADQIVKDREEAERERREVEAAESDDLVTLGELRKEEILKAKKAKEAEAAANEQTTTKETVKKETWADVDTKVIDAVFRALPEPLQHELSGKVYGEPTDDPATTRAAFLQDVIDRSVQHGITAKMPELERSVRAKLEKEMRPALEKAIRAELAGDEPSPDLDGGAPASNGGLTLEKYLAMTPNERMTLRRERPEVVDAMVRATSARAASRGAA